MQGLAQYAKWRTVVKKTEWIIVLAIFVLNSMVTVRAQIPTLQQTDPSTSGFAGQLAGLHLDSMRRAELEQAINGRDYKAAEKILVEEAEREPKSPRAAQLLVIAGGIFFLDGQYLNAAIAWKKAEAIAPLDDRSRFTLAMAYIRLNHGEWARPELEKLAAAQPQSALYLYWLARLDYDARNYTTAIARLQKVIGIDPKMMRGYDTLGLCFDYLGQFDEAIANYNRAIELNRLQARPSPWPHIDLAISLISVNRLAEAEANLRQAIAYDAQLTQAHYQLGRVLEMRGEFQAAVTELTAAAILDSQYAEPHLVLGRIYHRLGQAQQAEGEIARYQELKKAVNARPAKQSNPLPRN
jgi:tetratricopeptide (TPR) repeat protein